MVMPLRVSSAGTAVQISKQSLTLTVHPESASPMRQSSKWPTVLR